jgi:fructuronate reductase
MKLSKSAIKDRQVWENAGIELPEFNIDKMQAVTKEEPTWVHFGAGNIFRGFIAVLQQELLNLGKVQTGIIAVETYDHEIIDSIYEPYDNLSLLVLMEPEGTLRKKVIASVSESLVGETSREGHWKRLEDIFKSQSLQMVSFTVTEKGYSLMDISENYLPYVVKDFKTGPESPRHLISKVAALTYLRYKNGKLPIAFVSMDNCSHNGDVLKDVILTVAKNWVDNGHVESEFLEYLNDKQKVSFPWTMIDKITPRPSEKIKDDLNKIGFLSTRILCTDKNTFIAPFVNAEVPQYLVIEDDFPNGRMPLEVAGVFFTDRETVDMVEKMKVTTCLNPLHTTLAVFGCLLDYKLIAHEMKDRHLKKLVEKIGYEEGMPVVVNPGIIDPKDFIDEVINKRLKNPFIPDSPQRIATDTSQKVGIRFGETIKTYASSKDLKVENLKFIPLAIAGWLRYLLGVNDKGEKFKLSPDPMLDELKEYLEGIEMGNTDSVEDKLRPILSNKNLFGIDLYDVKLAEKIEGYFKEMIVGKNAVRNVLAKYLEE